MRLRGGAETNDRRLDRIPKFDERSRKFSVRDVVPARQRSYTWRCKPHFDQGAEGACVGFGVGHELAARPAEVSGLTNERCRGFYWEAQKIDGWPGGAYPGATPRYEGTSVLAGVQVAHKLGYMEAYRWAFNFDDFLLGVGHAGPAVIGINWWTGMFDTDSKGFLEPTGIVEGGHCTLVTAVNVPAETVTLHNSWGASWGVGGNAKIRWRHMRKLLADDGEACFFIGRRATPRPASRK
jgi:hypothetical protein